MRSVRASLQERNEPLPGDELIAQPIGSFTHAVSIRSPGRDVWRWIAQMGAGSRAGWYSYDFLDNGRRRSLKRIAPELQAVSTGMLFPALPGENQGFRVVAFEKDRYLILGWPAPTGSEPLVTWAFVLRDSADGGTRLIVRVRGARGYPFYGLPPRIGRTVVRFLHFVMERRQLVNLASRAESEDQLFDGVMPAYDVIERHHVRVRASAAHVMKTATGIRFGESLVVRALVRARELILGAKRETPAVAQEPDGLLDVMQALGWRVLAETPGREVVMGAVTQPWMANVVFQGLDPDAFRSFNTPGFVKIAWTLRVDPVGPDAAVFRTETRVVATDPEARRRFRRYWTRFSPGIVLIRYDLLWRLKRLAEHASRHARRAA